MKLNDYMVFNIHVILIISQQPVPPFTLCKYPTQYSFSHWLFFHTNIVETMVSGERGTNSVTMTIINLREKLLEPGIKPVTYYQVLYATDCDTQAKQQ